VKTAPVLFLLPLFFLYGCTEDVSHKGIARIGVDFVWDLEEPGLSPEIHLKNVPKKTARLKILFFDATNNWEHGGGAMPYDGSPIIPAGAVNGFKGLSSMWGFPKFEVTVEALDKDGNSIGKGNIVKRGYAQSSSSGL
jgi:hypothetical protein